MESEPIGRKLIIRPATEKDLREVYRIEKASFPDYYPYGLLLTYLHIARDLFLVALLNDIIVGYVIGVIRRNRIGHVVNIAVDSQFRRKGIGTELMKKLIELFKNREVELVRLEVRISNIPARKLYEKLGFTNEYIIPNYYIDGEACLVMVKRLECEYSPGRKPSLGRTARGV